RFATLEIDDVARLQNIRRRLRRYADIVFIDVRASPREPWPVDDEARFVLRVYRHRFLFNLDDNTGYQTADDVVILQNIVKAIAIRRTLYRDVRLRAAISV